MFEKIEMSDKVYLDTSALAKWYLNEENSDKFVQFLQDVPLAVISDLTATEMRSLLARRRRMHEITPSLEMEIFSTFQMDIDQGHLMLLPFHHRGFEEATHLIGSLQNIPLRTLDALHLTIIKHHHIQTLATADQAMSHAANQLGIQVVMF